ncbi:hypothetical protein Zmor_005742 [Zophobas morio]|uniref:Uncharacterized protein n=1 Tax=Zophobas morio TaxID=2755281 RepID=A0AA38MMI2_9CUCU|nr:hypothetical protein Zmor_005742 [Zophobas morio]
MNAWFPTVASIYIPACLSMDPERRIGVFWTPQSRLLLGSSRLPLAFALPMSQTTYEKQRVDARKRIGVVSGCVWAYFVTIFGISCSNA